MESIYMSTNVGCVFVAPIVFAVNICQMMYSANHMLVNDFSNIEKSNVYNYLCCTVWLMMDAILRLILYSTISFLTWRDVVRYGELKDDVVGRYHTMFSLTLLHCLCTLFGLLLSMFAIIKLYMISYDSVKFSGETYEYYKKYIVVLFVTIFVTIITVVSSLPNEFCAIVRHYDIK